MLKQYLLNVLIGLDQFCNAILGGDPGETISSRSEKAMREGKLWGCVLCKFLSWFQSKHCQKSLEVTEGAKAVIPD